ncbi:PREDICTED: major pollen allergen Ole e 10-like [Nicotiana attenuata]|uniref:Major pollen allergen ole e 10 n=1 Tax=Nicotiana attenuata TaxID=49451 RepID=A0A314KR91_NICAT|nr:PREDICTED: major pollen allergen Ole e 10-like [Nicotiana attenuata]OIT31803.1 major pollen allergen ole e 10 [Nicotiana attenuata]
MAHSFQAFPILILYLLLAFSNTGGTLKPANAQASGQWCVPRPSATEAQLLDSIQFVCGEKGLPGCSLIQAGGSCFYPDTTINHASVVMNLWYQLEGRQTVSCWFKNTALITITDPSYGNCQFVFGQ